MFYNQLLNQFAWDNSRKGRKCVKRLTWAVNGVFAGKLKHKHIEKHETFRRPFPSSNFHHGSTVDIFRQISNMSGLFGKKWDSNDLMNDMTLTAAFSRYIRRYILTQEVLFSCIFLIILYQSVFHVKPIWRYIQRTKLNFQLRWKGQYEKV